MPLEFTPFLGILAGIAFTLLLSTLAILTIIRLKYRGKVATPSATPTTALPSQADEEEYYPSPRPLRPADSVPLYPPSGAGSEDSSSGYASSGGRAAGGGSGPDIIHPASRSKGTTVKNIFSELRQ